MKYFTTYSRVFTYEFEAANLDAAAKRAHSFASTFPSGECLILSVYAEDHNKDVPCPDCKPKSEARAEQLRAGFDKATK